LSGAGVICAAICALWLVGLAAWALRAALRYRARRARFLHAAREAGFTDQETECLWWIGKFAANPDRLAVLNSSATLDDSLQKADAATSGDRTLWPVDLTDSLLSAVRRKLGGGRRMLWNIATTRQIEVNQPLRVRVGGGEEFESFAVEPAADSLRITLPVAPGAVPEHPAGRPVDIFFYRPQDARYRCRSRALAPDPDHTLRIDHAELTRIQQREVVRVRCRDEVRVAVVGRASASAHERLRAMPDGAFTARLRDLGAGGASFFSLRVREVDSWVLMKFRLNHAPGAVLVPARVVRVTQLGGTSESPLLVCVRFDPLTPRIEHHIGRLVADIQQRLIQRMLQRGSEIQPDLRPALDESLRPVPSPVEDAPVVSIHTARAADRGRRIA
jgi:c-di-GMP-binding flagellar brake protein YcgR